MSSTNGGPTPDEVWPDDDWADVPLTGDDPIPAPFSEADAGPAEGAGAAGASVEDDWANIPETEAADDPFESPWMAEPGAFYQGDASVDVDGEWAEAIEAIELVEEADPFALPGELGSGIEPDLGAPDPGSDLAAEPDDADAWDFWSPTTPEEPYE